MSPALVPLSIKKVLKAWFEVKLKLNKSL